jgi:hypothetical protein
MTQNRVAGPADALNPGIVQLAGDLGGTALSPALVKGATVPAHSHRRPMAPAPLLQHTNNMASLNLYPANASSANPSSGHYLIVLNANSTFILRNDATDYYLGTNADGAKHLRTPNAQAGVGMGAYAPSGEDYSGDITVTFVQDDAGSFTPTIQYRQLAAKAAPSLSSGTTGQWRTLVFRYLGPFVGWQAIYDSGSWATGFPYALAPSSTRGGAYMRAIVNSGSNNTNANTMLDNFAKTPLNYRKGLYAAGVMLESAPVGAVSAFHVGNNSSQAAQISANGLTLDAFPRHITCMVSLLTDPIASTIHETGHAADFVLLNNAAEAGAGGYVRDDPTLTSLWKQDHLEWLASGAADTTGYDAAVNYGWGGSQGYYVWRQTEWIAQTIAAYMHRKWCVANSASTTTADTAWTLANNPTRRSAVSTRLDALLAAFI